MPQLNVASSPSPVIAPPASANTTSAEAPANAATEDQPAQPFAAVLQRQVTQQAAAPADKTTKAPTDRAAKVLAVLKAGMPAGRAAEALAALKAGAAEGKATGAATALKAEMPAEKGDQPSTDALAAIAQMLAGITPPSQQTPQGAFTSADDKARKPASTDDAADAILLATPGMPTTPGVIPVASASDHAPEPAAPKALSGSGIATSQAENLASDDLQMPVNHAGSSNGEAAESFESLLATATPREVSIAAAGQTVVHTAHNTESTTASVASPVGTRGWNNEIGEKLTWMVNRQESRCELVLNPPQLGRIEVSISMNGDQANATFVSANSAVREALENAVPRLREILQDAGIALGQTQVGAESFQQAAGNTENGDNSSRSKSAEQADDTVLGSLLGGNNGPAQLLRRGNGLVDLFA